MATKDEKLALVMGQIAQAERYLAAVLDKSEPAGARRWHAEAIGLESVVDELRKDIRVLRAIAKDYK